MFFYLFVFIFFVGSAFGIFNFSDDIFLILSGLFYISFLILIVIDRTYYRDTEALERLDRLSIRLGLIEKKLELIITSKNFK